MCPSAKSFPIALIPKCSGNANKEIVENFKKIVENVKKIVNVVGVAFDGDSGWLHLAKHSATTTKNLILQSLLKNEKIFSLDKYVILYDDKNIDQLPFLIFEDLLHLVKCFRYRLISGCGICPSVYSDENNFISNENFQTVGIPPWILDNAKYLKMDDGLPLKLFTFENIQKCILKDRYDLAYSLIPCTLLINSIMNDELDRTARIEMLSIGYSIVFLYLNELEKYSNFKKDRKQKTSKNGGKCMHLTLMDKKWCAKYLSLCASLVYVLNDCHAVDLGSLGSHKLEHFFGKVRQFARGNDSYDNFEYCVYSAILAHSLEQEIGIQMISPKRTNSSGSIIPEVAQTIACDLSFPLQLAAMIHLRFSQDVYCKELFNKIKELPTNVEISDPFYYILLLLSSKQPTPKVRTTTSERITVSTGKSQKRNLSISSQLKNISVESNEDKNKNNNQSNIEVAGCRRSPRLKARASNSNDHHKDSVNLVNVTFDHNFNTIRAKTQDTIDRNIVNQLIQTAAQNAFLFYEEEEEEGEEEEERGEKEEERGEEEEERENFIEIDDF